MSLALPLVQNILCIAGNPSGLDRYQMTERVSGGFCRRLGPRALADPYSSKEI